MNGSPWALPPVSTSAHQYQEEVLGVFDPQPDITAYELAVLLPIFLHGMTRQVYDALGPMQRHIRLAS